MRRGEGRREEGRSWKKGEEGGREVGREVGRKKEGVGGVQGEEGRGMGEGEEGRREEFGKGGGGGGSGGGRDELEERGERGGKEGEEKMGWKGRKVGKKVTAQCIGNLSCNITNTQGGARYDTNPKQNTHIHTFPQPYISGYNSPLSQSCHLFKAPIRTNNLK